MKLSPQVKEFIVTAITYLYIFLFVYAAISKLMDFEKFQIQIGQSPLFSAFAGTVSVFVPSVELLIVILLCIPKYRFVALFSSFILMVLFTTYIIFILYFSTHTPCSCGGVLENMGWREHLIFNLIFISLALLAVLLYDRSKLKNPKIFKHPSYLYIAFILSVIFSFLIISGLYIWSERIIHQRNNFIRRFDSHAQPESKKIDLRVNSYYFSGSSGSNLYLGNRTAPLTLSIIDTTLLVQHIEYIKIDRTNFNYHSLQLKILNDNFFLADGTVPCIYQGKISNWKGKLWLGKITPFTLALPLGQDSLAIRITSPSSAANILGLYTYSDKLQLHVNQNLLEKQIDGIFDTDGMLLSDVDFGNLIYVYYYRNEYIVSDKNLKKISIGHTIDTVSRAQLSVANLSNETKMRTLPVVVNKLATVTKNLLFIYSERIGKYEDKKMLDHAGIVDVYDLYAGKYISSIYVYHVDGKKMTAFAVYGAKLYTLSGNFLTVMHLDKTITAHYRITDKNTIYRR